MEPEVELTADEQHDKELASSSRKKKVKVDKRSRSVSFSVVAKDAATYRLIAATVRAFRCLCFRLAAENMLAVRATSEIARGRLIPYFKAKKGAAAALYGAPVRKAPNYESRIRFFEIWKEFQSKALAPDKNKNVIPLPDLGSWVWDAMKARFDAAVSQDLWKRIDTCTLQRFDNFGLGTVECASRSGYAKILLDEESGDISISLRFFREAPPVILIAKGIFEMKGELVPKEINAGHESLLRRFAKGGLEWSDPRVRLTKKGELILDISYKKGVWVKRTDCVKNRVFEVTLEPSTFTVEGKKGPDGRDLDRVIKLACEGHIVENGVKPSSSGKFDWKGIHCQDIVSYLSQFEREKLRREESNDAAKSNRDAKTLEYFREKQAHASARRHKFVREKCHIWAKEIIGQAKRFNAESIVIKYPAKKAKGESKVEPLSPLLHGYSWQWDLLKQSIKYHGADAGYIVTDEPLLVDTKDIIQDIKEQEHESDCV